MTKFRWMSVVKYEFDDETNRTKVISAFTKPIEQTAASSKKGNDKLEFKGSTSTGKRTLE